MQEPRKVTHPRDAPMLISCRVETKGREAQVAPSSAPAFRWQSYSSEILGGTSVHHLLAEQPCPSHFDFQGPFQQEGDAPLRVLVRTG